LFYNDFAIGGSLLIHLVQNLSQPSKAHAGPIPYRVLNIVSDYVTPDSLTELLRERSLQLLVTDGSYTVPEGQYFVKERRFIKPGNFFQII
jgi:hypothetical protein